MKSNSKSATETPSSVTPSVPADDPTAAYQCLVAMLSEYKRIENELTDHQLHVERVVQMAAEAVLADHSKLTVRKSELEEKMENLVRQHPEWLGERKSVVTPFGTVKMTASAKLLIESEELSIDLIKRRFPGNSGTWIRVDESLNLDVLGALPDRTLKRFKITRVRGDNFSITLAKASMGKALKAAAKKEVQ